MLSLIYALTTKGVLFNRALFYMDGITYPCHNLINKHVNKRGPLYPTCVGKQAKFFVSVYENIDYAKTIFKCDIKLYFLL